MLTHEDCLVEVFNEQGKIINIKPRKEASPRDILKTVYIFVCNPKGELWLTIAPGSKMVWPNHYWPSACGVVRHKEDPDRAALRTVRRELGIKNPNLKFLGARFIDFKGMRHFASCYCCTCDDAIQPDSRDVSKGDFLAFDELEDLMSHNRSGFSPMFLQLYDMFKGELKKAL